MHGTTSRHRTRQHALATARGIVAANSACDTEDFLRDRMVIVEADLLPGRMPFHLGRPHLALTTFGAGVVVTVSPQWKKWAQRLVRGLDRDDIFSPACLARAQRQVQRSGQILAGPQHRYICAEELHRPVDPPAGVILQCVRGADLEPLHDLPFQHGLGPRGSTERPDMLAVTARIGDEIVGLAAAGADHPDMWQIGVSVLESHQGAGIGAGLVSMCTRAVLESGRVPYYSTHLSNLRSQAVAIRCGFVMAWTEAYVYVPRTRRVEGDYLGLQRPAQDD